jgi:hypothetical protein
MEAKIQDAITKLLEKAVSQSSSADSALKFTQAALNLAHTQLTLKTASTLK